MVEVKPRGIMDHNQLFLTVPMVLDRLPKPFQFFNYMSSLPSFLNLVQSAWNTTCHGDPMGIFCKKLKLVKGELVKLNKAHGNFHTLVHSARATIHDIQDLLKYNHLDDQLLIKEWEAVKLLEDALSTEESLLHQNSRSQWLELGDGNNSYFFNQTKANWNTNKILALQNADGTVVFGHKNVSQVAVDFFSNSLGYRSPVTHNDFEHLECNVITKAQAASLEQPVIGEIILATLKAMPRNKSPGPDGFTAEVFLEDLEIIGPDFCKAVQHFFATSNMHLGVNSTSIALIPKVSNPVSMKEFRPISLCSIMYKCISKIIANRMKALMPHLVNDSQSAFISSRSISDNILMAQELFRGYNRDSERITAKITSQTIRFLSSVSRVQLTRAVLLSIQAYWSKHLILPGTTHKAIQRILTRFIWKGDITKTGGAKVSWENLCAPKEVGGLGLKNAVDWNRAQILLLLCRIVFKHKSLWVQWILKTAFHNKIFWTMKIPTDCSWIWCKVLKLRDIARQHLIFKMGNGKAFSFWFAPWWNNTCLVTSKKDLAISQLKLAAHTSVEHLISTGAWCILEINQRIHHIDPRLRHWLQTFDRPAFDLEKEDKIQWGEFDLCKIKTRHIWDSIRFRNSAVTWYKFV
ncbi:uncharacterized protein LOC141685998 [Apium graveolens]|uniref:uncharacterized protein LOC141685998 n=1 Tax=Apium graveolens TaxID=4045 RepID=UPI003D7BEA37